MKHKTHLKRSLHGACLLAASAFFTTVASAGTFDTIDVTGSPTQFDGVADSYTETTASGDSIDIASLQITNDSNFLYLNLTFQSAVNPNDGSAGASSSSAGDGQILNIAFDLDNNPATGDNIYGNPAIGSELGYQNDYPFQQATGNYNTGATVVGGGAEISPFDSTTTDQIIAIPLTSTVNGNLLFTQSTFDLGFYTTGASGTVDSLTGPIQYTLAVAPEPQTWGMLLGGFAMLLFIARRRGGSLSNPSLK